LCRVESFLSTLYGCLPSCLYDGIFCWNELQLISAEYSQANTRLLVKGHLLVVIMQCT
jgi:hypothetical protein